MNTKKLDKFYWSAMHSTGLQLIYYSEITFVRVVSANLH